MAAVVAVLYLVAAKKWAKRHDRRMAAVEAWFLGGPVDGRRMLMKLGADGCPPAVAKLPQTGFYVGSSDVAAPAVEHVHVLADRLHDTEMYQHQQPAQET
ncbi:hypothetical protein [Micromonospora sp. NPDC003776]